MTTILIDTTEGESKSAFLFQTPYKVVATNSPQNVEEKLAEVEAEVKAGRYAAGFCSYELGYVLEPKLSSRITATRTPLLWFGIFDNLQKLSNLELDSWLEHRSDESLHDGYSIENIRLDLEQEKYEALFAKIKTYIANGDVYQLNFTFQADFDFSGDIYKFYRTLKRQQRMSHGGLIDGTDFKIISASPELFLSIRNSIATTAPMKGTAPRGRTLKEDENIISWLRNDIKSRAENLMIVDLMRNDLGRISETGEVHVNDLFKVETYPTLHQMTSHISSKLKPDLPLIDLMRALHPPGSITGAPKVRAMELIQELETRPRGVYTGTIGMLLPSEFKSIQTYFNVAIRTLTLWPNGQAEMGIGSGIVSDSVAVNEYEECKLKMRFLTHDMPEFDLLESLAYAPQEGYKYYEHHLQRLANSAKYFQFNLDIGKVEAALRLEAEKLHDGDYRVRLLLSRSGEVTVASTKFTPPTKEDIYKFVISEKRMNRDNIFLYHKTTNRAFYDDEHAEVTSRRSCDEVVFLNEKGEMTEGSRTNIFIEKDGILYTPKIECGLLAGTLREDLLQKGLAKQAILESKDLLNADAIFLGNSVRGLIRAEEMQQ